MSAPASRSDRAFDSTVYTTGARPARPRAKDKRGSRVQVFRHFLVSMLVLALVASATAACGGRASSALPEPGSVDADKFLFDRGTELLARKNWLTSREYFKKLIDTYPQSPFRHEARLGVGDSYLGENRTDAMILGVAEFRQFLQFAPLNPRADYAQYKICLGGSRQMLSAQRDQTATKEALADCDAFLRNYPNSTYRVEVEAIRRRVRDRLSDYEFNVGMTYFRQRLWQSAHDRFFPLLAADPGYTRRDRLYYYEAETQFRGGRVAEAMPFYARIVAEYPKSEYLKKAQARLARAKQ
jgi:outer membrane protein assembly factor BamD